VKRENQRARRVAEQIQRELPGLIRLEVDDPKVGMVTLTDVEVTGDLAHAKVFFTVLDEGVEAATVEPTAASATGQQPDRRAESLAALQRAAGFLRVQLGHRLLLRSVPQLHFAYDVSVERGVRLSRLIDLANDPAPQS